MCRVLILQFMRKPREIRTQADSQTDNLRHASLTSVGYRLSTPLHHCAYNFCAATTADAPLKMRHILIINLMHSLVVSQLTSAIFLICQTCSTI